MLVFAAAWMVGLTAQAAPPSCVSAASLPPLENVAHPAARAVFPDQLLDARGHADLLTVWAEEGRIVRSHGGVEDEVVFRLTESPDRMRLKRCFRLVRDGDTYTVTGPLRVERTVRRGDEVLLEQSERRARLTLERVEGELVLSVPGQEWLGADAVWQLRLLDGLDARSPAERRAVLRLLASSRAIPLAVHRRLALPSSEPDVEKLRQTLLALPLVDATVVSLPEPSWTLRRDGVELPRLGSRTWALTGTGSAWIEASNTSGEHRQLLVSLQPGRQEPRAQPTCVYTGGETRWTHCGEAVPSDSWIRPRCTEWGVEGLGSFEFRAPVGRALVLDIEGEHPVVRVDAGWTGRAEPPATCDGLLTASRDRLAQFQAREKERRTEALALEETLEQANQERRAREEELTRLRRSWEALEASRVERERLEQRAEQVLALVMREGQIRLCRRGQPRKQAECMSRVRAALATEVTRACLLRGGVPELERGGEEAIFGQWGATCRF